MTQAIKQISNLRFALMGLGFGVLFPFGFYWLKGSRLPTLLELLVIVPLGTIAFGLSMRLVLPQQLAEPAEMQPEERQKAMNRNMVRTLFVLGSFWALALGLRYL